MSFSELSSQDIPKVLDLKFQERNTERIKIPDNVSIEDLNPYDMPEFKYTEETNYHHLYFDDNENPQEEIELLNSVNRYEDWENLGEKWLINQNGITTYDRILKGKYAIKRHLEHSNMSKAFYNVYKDNAKNNGLLPVYIYPPGVATQMVKDSNEYIFYNSDYPKTIITVEKSDTIYPPDITDPDFPNSGDSTIIRIEIEVFDTTICNNDLITSKIEIVKDTLANGECIKRIIETYYSNYEYACDEILSPRSSNINKIYEEQISVQSFSIFPNPLNNQMLILNVPNQLLNEDVEISLKTMQGNLIHKWQNMKALKKMSVNVGKHLFDYSGMYLISIKSKNKVFSKKFYYLK